MNTSFYNTTNEFGTALASREDQAQSQEKVILSIFKDYKKPLSASQVFNLFPNTNTPITSIRRAISNLKKKGSLKITTKKVIGIYKVPEHLYKIPILNTTN